MSNSVQRYGLQPPMRFSVHGISQARILKWVAISFSIGSSQPIHPIRDSCISRRIPLPLSRYYYVCMHAESLQLCPTLCDPWTVALQAPLSVGFSWQAYWSGLLCLLQGIFPVSLKCPALAGGFFITSASWEAQRLVLVFNSVFFSLSYSGELRRWERE